MAEEEDDETLIAAKMPGYPVAQHAAHDDDALPDEDATLLAIPRGAVAHAAHAARVAAGAPPYVPPAFPAMRPAAGLPPVRPAAGYPPQRPAAGLPPPPPPPARPGSTRPPATPPPPPPRQGPPVTLGETPKPLARPVAMGETPKPPARPVASTLPLPSFGQVDSVTLPNQLPVPNAARSGAVLGALPAPPPQSVHVPPGMPQPRAGLPPPPPPSRPAMSAPTQQSAVSMGESRQGAQPSQPPQASPFAPSTVVMGGSNAPAQASPTYAAAAHLPPPPGPPPPAPSYDQAIAPPPAQGLPSIVVRVLLGCGVVTVLGLLTLIYLEL